MRWLGCNVCFVFTGEKELRVKVGNILLVIGRSLRICIKLYFLKIAQRQFLSP